MTTFAERGTMMATKRLAIVPDGETALLKPQRPKSIATAVDSTERELLVALRAKAAAELDSGVPAHAISQLMKQLRELDKDIRALDARAKHEDKESGGSAEPVDDKFDASAI